MIRSKPPSDAQLLDCWHTLESTSGPLRRRIQRELQVRSGVPAAWIGVLLQLAGAKDQQQPTHVAAEQSGLTSGGFTKLADRMQQAGLLSRTHSDSDRRIIYLALTPEGSRQAARLASVQSTVLRRHLAALTGAEARTLIAALRAVQDPPGEGARTRDSA
jgi:DNA-binding MarR family transcriptional regulator